jgi:hypothetical protein
MAGPRKVRIFRDPKKSPNWYVEWRDLEGRRHSESCGPRKVSARERAREILQKLRRLRHEEHEEKLPGSERQSLPMVEVRAILKSPPFEAPVQMLVELGPEFICSIRELLGLGGS